MLVLKTPFMGTLGGVSSEHPMASIAGMKVLSSGGNAIDATVATSLSLAVTQPHLGSLGSDFFALIYESSSGKIHCLNASGWSPKRLTVEYLEERRFRNIPVESPHSVVVPGMIDGLRVVHEKFGTSEFKGLFEYPILLAEKGFPVSHGLSRAIKVNASKLMSKAAQDLFFREGKPLEPGEILIQKSLAKAFESLASNPRGFYDEWISKSLCDFIKAKGGVLEVDDFEDFVAEWVDPLKVKYRGFDVYEMPPNTQGATTLQILNILENFDLGDFKPFDADRVHLFVEAAKRAYKDKNRYLADPRFTKMPLEEILSKDYAKKLGETIDSNSVSVEASLQPLDTTNFAVVDKWGNVVSGIQSIFYHFGSGLLDPNTGIVLNSRGSYFNFKGPNRLESRKRPLHTLSSVIAASDEGEVWSLGMSGGDFRPQQHVLLLTNLFDYGMGLQEAVEAPRFLWTGGKNVLVEKGFKNLKKLKEIGHEISFREYPGRTGVAHCCEKRGNVSILSADIRGDGVSIGEIS
ncbi:MAG: gamma-glutamyltransferase [Candidatus Hodarchaeota archaeon]